MGRRSTGANSPDPLERLMDRRLGSFASDVTHAAVMFSGEAFEWAQREAFRDSEHRPEVTATMVLSAAAAHAAARACGPQDDDAALEAVFTVMAEQYGRHLRDSHRLLMAAGMGAV